MASILDCRASLAMTAEVPARTVTPSRHCEARSGEAIQDKGSGLSLYRARRWRHATSRTSTAAGSPSSILGACERDQLFRTLWICVSSDCGAEDRKRPSRAFARRRADLSPGPEVLGAKVLDQPLLFRADQIDGDSRGRGQVYNSSMLCTISCCDRRPWFASCFAMRPGFLDHLWHGTTGALKLQCGSNQPPLRRMRASSSNNGTNGPIPRHGPSFRFSPISRRNGATASGAVIPALIRTFFFVPA